MDMKRTKNKLSEKQKHWNNVFEQYNIINYQYVDHCGILHEAPIQFIDDGGRVHGTPKQYLAEVVAEVDDKHKCYRLISLIKKILM
jgi:hypothetical protein